LIASVATHDAQVPEETSESACGCGFPTELFGAVHNLGFGKNLKSLISQNARTDLAWE